MILVLMLIFTFWVTLPLCSTFSEMQERVMWSLLGSVIWAGWVAWKYEHLPVSMVKQPMKSGGIFSAPPFPAYLEQSFYLILHNLSEN